MTGAAYYRERASALRKLAKAASGPDESLALNLRAVEFDYLAEQAEDGPVQQVQQRGTVGLVLRVIPMQIRTIDELMLPPVLKRIAEEERGLVLVTGTTGSGKSTTLAALIDYVNRSRTAHVMTVEDPIEFLHRDQRSIINQREVTVDTRSFAQALRSALRQDPDVILVGEMRDFETIETGLLAAETGHLVLSTLHTLDATETINRIIAVFPPHQQKQVRLQLAAVLKAVISQRLIPRADSDGRAPAVEVMISTAFIRDCIVDNEKTHLINSAIAAGKLPRRSGQAAHRQADAAEQQHRHHREQRQHRGTGVAQRVFRPRGGGGRMLGRLQQPRARRPLQLLLHTFGERRAVLEQAVPFGTALLIVALDLQTQPGGRLKVVQHEAEPGVAR